MKVAQKEGCLTKIWTCLVDDCTHHGVLSAYPSVSDCTVCQSHPNACLSYSMYVAPIPMYSLLPRCTEHSLWCGKGRCKPLPLTLQCLATAALCSDYIDMRCHMLALEKHDTHVVSHSRNVKGMALIDQWMDMWIVRFDRFRSKALLTEASRSFSSVSTWSQISTCQW